MIQEYVVLDFHKPSGSTVNFQIVCTRILAGLQTPEGHTCLKFFNLGEEEKRNQLKIEDISINSVSCTANLKFIFKDNKAKEIILKELKFYLTNLTPKGIRFSF